MSILSKSRQAKAMHASVAEVTGFSTQFSDKVGVKFDKAKICIKFKGKLNSMAGRQKHLPEKRCQ